MTDIKREKHDNIIMQYLKVEMLMSNCNITQRKKMLNKLLSAWIAICLIYLNLKDILAEWQTAWNLTRCWITCKGLTIMISRLKINIVIRSRKSDSLELQFGSNKWEAQVWSHRNKSKSCLLKLITILMTLLLYTFYWKKHIILKTITFIHNNSMLN